MLTFLRLPYYPDFLSGHSTSGLNKRRIFSMYHTRPDSPSFYRGATASGESSMMTDKKHMEYALIIDQQ
mgnify:CR=1 FL=1